MRLQTRGPEEGICNICGQFSRLTDDHIPPKGVPLVGQAYLSRLTDTLGAERPRKAVRLFQRGVKYRSICARCNNDVLGAKYDPVLITLCTELHSVLQREVHLPVAISIPINRLVRSFVGHILAHGVGEHRVGELASRLTEYFQDDSQPFPHSLRAYCWVYPYKAQVVAHGLGSIFDFQFARDAFVFSLSKFYPVAFMCAIADLPASEAAHVTRIDQLTSVHIDDHARVAFSLPFVPGGRWPEAPGKNGAVFHNSRGTVATPAQT